jgi:hypothetical protein
MTTETTLALCKSNTKIVPYKKPWETSAPAYTIRALTSFGKELHGSASKDSRPEITSKNVIGALSCTLRRAPSFSLVSRSYVDETRECTKSPGPLRYTIPGTVGNPSHPLYPMPPSKVFVGSSRKIHETSDTPAPGEYEINAGSYLTKAPAYGFRMKPLDRMQSALAPDSGSYNVVNMGKNGKLWRGPSWSLRGRPENLKQHEDVDDNIMELVVAEAPAILGRRKLDTCGTKRTKPVPNWSFSKAERFV